MTVIKAHWKQLQLQDKKICKAHLNLSQIQHEAESLYQLSYAKNRINKSALRSTETFHFVSKKPQQNPTVFQNRNLMLITGVKVRLQSRCFIPISNLICHQTLFSNWIYLAQCETTHTFHYSLCFYLHINTAMNQTTVLAHFFLAPAQTSAANPSASYHLLKHQMHKHISQRGADRATWIWFLC